jgi:hypothetical protein
VGTGRSEVADNDRVPVWAARWSGLPAGVICHCARLVATTFDEHGCSDYGAR